MAGQISVTQIKSGIGSNQKQRATLKGLGLTKMNQTRTLKDTPEVRGMINKISHLLKWEEA